MRKARQFGIPVAAVLCACLAWPPPGEASSTYYRWKDERGRLVVSDRPPPDEGVDYEVVSPDSTLIRRVMPGQGAVPPEVDPRPGNEFNPVDTQEQVSVAKKNPEMCARARSNLETLNTAARIRVRDSQSGELRYLTEEEKESQREKARSIVKDHCE